MIKYKLMSNSNANCLRYTNPTGMVHSSKEPEWSQDFKNVKSFKIGPGTTRLGRFEWSRLNSLLPIVKGDGIDNFDNFDDNKMG